MELVGKTFAPPHLPHMFGTLGVNLPHLPPFTLPSKQAPCQVLSIPLHVLFC
jgi:hypothetical protein